MKYHFINHHRFIAKILSSFSLICCVITTFAQSWMVTGKVVSPDGKPFQSVNITVKDLMTGTRLS